MGEVRTIASRVVAGSMLLALAWVSGVPAEQDEAPALEIERPRLEPRLEPQPVPSIPLPSETIEPGDNFADPGLALRLRDDHWQTRRLAAREARDLGPAAVGVLPELLAAYDAALEPGDLTTRTYVVEAIGVMGAPAAQAAPLLVRAAGEDPTATVRRQAVRSLGAIGVVTPEVVGALDRAAAEEANAANRIEAVDALAALVPVAGRELPAMVAVFSRVLQEEPVYYGRAAAARALGSIGPPALELGAGPVLVAALGDGRPTVRDAAAEALGRLGPGAQALVPEIEQMSVEHARTGTGRAADRAIGLITGEQAAGEGVTEPAPDLAGVVLPRPDPSVPVQPSLPAWGEEERSDPFGVAERYDVPSIEVPWLEGEAVRRLVGHYRVVANGFHVARGTRDRDPSLGDDAFLKFIVLELDQAGQVLQRRVVLSPVAGSTARFPFGIRAGSATSRGGLRSGDQVPVANPYRRREEPGSGKLPLLVWEGVLGGEVEDVVILSSIWRAKPSPADAYVRLFDGRQAAFAAGVLEERGEKLVVRCETNPDIRFVLDMGLGYGDFYLGPRPVAGVEASYLPATGGDQQNLIELSGALGSVYLNRNRSMLYFRSGQSQVDWCRARIEQTPLVRLYFYPGREPTAGSATRGGARVDLECRTRNRDVSLRVDLQEGFADLALAGHAVFSLATDTPRDDVIELRGEIGSVHFYRSLARLYGGGEQAAELCELDVTEAARTTVQSTGSTFTKVAQSVVAGLKNAVGAVSEGAKYVGRGMVRGMQAGIQSAQFLNPFSRPMRVLKDIYSAIVAEEARAVLPTERPIGINNGDYEPHVLHLDWATAELIREYAFPQGVGVITQHHRDEHELGGYYMLYLQVERM